MFILSAADAFFLRIRMFPPILLLELFLQLWINWNEWGNFKSEKDSIQHNNEVLIWSRKKRNQIHQENSTDNYDIIADTISCASFKYVA